MKFALIALGYFVTILLTVALLAGHQVVLGGIVYAVGAVLAVRELRHAGYL
jgi:hypothetical protein